MQIRIYDNYFTEKECKELIDLYDKYKYLAVPFYNVIPLKVKKLLPKNVIPAHDGLTLKL